MEESQTLERKKALPKKEELRASLCAFANSTPEGHHSALVIGVTDEGERRGVNPAELDAYQKTIRDVCQQDCYPPIAATPQIVEDEGKTFLVVIVGFSSKKPHFTGPAYVRFGSESVKANEAQFEELVASRTEKARKLLSEKGRAVSVHWKNQPTVVGAFGAGSKWVNLNKREYSIESCDNFTVELRDQATGSVMSAPLAEVEIARDMEKRRMRLIIDFKFLYKG